MQTQINQLRADLDALQLAYNQMLNPYPASVAAAQWDARSVWDLQKPGNVGHRTLTKKFGVDPLPAGCQVVNGIFIYIQSTNVILEGWDFSSLAGGVYIPAGKSATFSDCLFRCGSTTIYNLEVEGVATCLYCTFDGTGSNTNGSNYIVRPSGSLTLTRCVSQLAQNDTGKSQGTFAAQHCLYLPTAANPAAHLDGHQLDQGTANFTDCLFDARGNTNTQTPMNNYVRIESNGGTISSVVVQRCICIGQKASGGLDPFQIHVNPNPISGVKFIDNLWQRGANGHYFYPSVPAGSIAQWANNRDFDTGDLYPQAT